jgi:hypothetical protein
VCEGPVIEGVIGPFSDQRITTVLFNDPKKQFCLELNQHLETPESIDGIQTQKCTYVNFSYSRSPAHTSTPIAALVVSSCLSVKNESKFDNTSQAASTLTTILITSSSHYTPAN